MSDEFDSQRLRPAGPPRKSGTKKGNGNGSKNSRASVANLDHHRLYREIEQLRHHGQEVLARTREMMSLLEKNLKRAQGSVDAQKKREEQKKRKPGEAALRRSRGPRPTRMKRA